MSDRTKRQEASVALAERLAKTGMPIAAYRRSPRAPESSFILSIPRSSIRVWAGDANISAHTSKRHKQAVLTVAEPARSMTEWVRPYISTSLPQSEYFGLPEKKAAFERQLRSYATSIPNSTLTVDYGSIQSWPGGSAPGYVRCRITQSTNATKTSFLVGTDETAAFVAELPLTVNSVEAAHDVLRPQYVPKGSPRQGEWFFVPVTEAEQKKLVRKGREDESIKSSGLEQYSSHTALQVSFDGKRFTPGPVIDSRPNHHAPLFLDGWHRIFRNSEVANDFGQNWD